MLVFRGNVYSFLFDWKDEAIRATKSLDILVLIDKESICPFARFAALYHGLQQSQFVSNFL